MREGFPSPEHRMSPEGSPEERTKDVRTKERAALERFRGPEKKRMAMAMLVAMKLGEALSPTVAHAESASDYDPMAGLEATENESSAEAEKRHNEKKAELKKRFKNVHAPSIEGANPLFTETVRVSPDGEVADTDKGPLTEAKIENLGKTGLAISFLDARHHENIGTSTSVGGSEATVKRTVDVSEADETAVYEMPADLKFKGEPLTFEINGIGDSRADALLEALRAAGHHLDAAQETDATVWESVSVTQDSGDERRDMRSEDIRFDATSGVAYLTSFRVVGETPTVGEDGKVTVHIEATGYGKTHLETPETAE